MSLGLLMNDRALDADLLEELEEKLIKADLGPAYVSELIEELEELSDDGQMKSSREVLPWLREKLLKDLQVEKKSRSESAKPAVWFFLGVNGVGKTTSLGKLGKRLADNHFKIIFAAADTFRAAAGAQLSLWSERCGSQIVRHQEGGDPSAVIFDAYDAAKNRDVDFLMIDTAGRLHNKKNLMKECEKMFRTIQQKGGVAEEVFLVVDATTGQNAVQQAQLFGEIAPLTGLILTKMDGTAKGGVAFRLVRESGIPIRYLGVGEGVEDLIDFDAKFFIDAILPEESTA